jgi:serine/threonine protein phosphatase PrpC
MYVEAASRTDIGRIRTVNEDRSIIRKNFFGYTLTIVADGMGGHQAGDTASQMAIDLIEKKLLVSLSKDLDAENQVLAMKEAIAYANREIYAMASQQMRYHGMGTTVVVALADEVQIIIGHIGDSRAYLIEKKQIRQLTEDHTLVNELIKSGQLSQSESGSHPRRNVLTRALGTEQNSEVDLQRVVWHAGDILLVCTDGLSGLVDSERMLSIITDEKLSIEMKVSVLIELALEVGGEDNITASLLANSYVDLKGGELK